MTRQGKPENSKDQSEFSHAFLRAWKSGEKPERRIPTATTAGRV
jgi:hypothetical protein